MQHGCYYYITMDISIIKNNGIELSIEFRNVHISIINSLRRIMIAEIPTVAIEKVIVHDNTSYINSEQLAARLSVIPLRCDPNILNKLDYLPMTLQVDSQSNSTKVTADLIKIPDQRITLSNPNIPILLLATDQRIDITMFYTKGNGRIHNKFSPVAAVEMIPKGNVTVLNIESAGHMDAVDIFEQSIAMLSDKCRSSLNALGTDF